VVKPASARRRPDRLQPLASRKVRVRLLLSSYLDACEPDKSERLARGDKPTSRDLRRRSAVWTEGSYRELDRCLDALRVRHRPVYRDTWDRWVLGDAQMNGKRAARAHVGVALLAMVMPQAIYVPLDICEAFGYAPSEAKQYGRPGRKKPSLVQTSVPGS
jgi:hypothetical protein